MPPSNAAPGADHRLARVRRGLSAAAAVLSLVALLVSVLDSAQLEAAFFALAAVAAGVQAWVAREPFDGARRNLGRGIALGWLGVAIWTGVLLAMFQEASRPAPQPEATYLGLTATVYHVAAFYGGTVLVLLAAVLPPRRADTVAASPARPTR